MDGSFIDSDPTRRRICFPKVTYTSEIPIVNVSDERGQMIIVDIPTSNAKWNSPMTYDTAVTEEIDRIEMKSF